MLSYLREVIAWAAVIGVVMFLVRCGA